MNDTTNPLDHATTLSTMVGSALIQGASSRQALVAAREALDAGDLDRVASIIRSATAPVLGRNPDSIQDAVRVSLPSSGEQVAYG